MKIYKVVIDKKVKTFKTKAAAEKAAKAAKAAAEKAAKAAKAAAEKKK